MYLITQRYINDKQQKVQKKSISGIELIWNDSFFLYFVLLVDFIGLASSQDTQWEEIIIKKRKKLKRAQVDNFNNKNLLSLSKYYYNNNNNHQVNKQIKKRFDFVSTKNISFIIRWKIKENISFVWHSLGGKNILLTIFNPHCNSYALKEN